MIVQIDTKDKKVLVLDNIKMKDLLKELETLLPNKKWADYTLINPYYVEPQDSPNSPVQGE